MKENHILYKFFLLAMMGVIPMIGWADDVFKHYQGIANKEGDYEIINASAGCLRQKTHEYHYYVPVQSDSSVSLNLPIVNFTSDSGGNSLEPRGFFRWYNYDTDYQSANIHPYNVTYTHLQEMEDENNLKKGWVAYSISDNAIRRNVGVLYTRPTDANWKGETIACDVSRYVDGIENKTFTHEPTLSMRYIFHVIPAEQRADTITEALRSGLESKANDLTFEDNKEISVGLKATSSKVHIRLNANDPSLYYFHPMANANTHHVFFNDEQNKIQAADLTSSSLVKPTNIQWRVYDSSKSKYCWYTYNASEASCRFFEITLDKLNGIGASAWRKLGGTAITAAEKPSFTYGDRVYIVALAVNGNNMCPIANFTVSFYNHYPMTFEQLQNASENTRLVDYLDEHYRSVATISFDDDDEKMTLEKPTTPSNNQAQLPSKWSKRSYGFVYPTLIDKTSPVDNVSSGNYKWKDPKHSPIHGEYGLYKSANVRGISGSGDSFTDQYLWYQSGTLYDRTYASTNGAQYGHFLYIDAADESRQMAEADFKANLCVGSQVIFSSAIADMTSGTIKPEVMFKLYGVHYDANNKETDRKLLHSFSTGYFEGNVDNYSTCKWYQGYGKMVLQKESGVGNYEDFKIVVDNLCTGTNGADYAFDDLRIYTQASKVDVIQSTPICPSVDINKGYNATDMKSIKLKIRAMQETMEALADHTEKKLYFRFVDAATEKPTTDVNYATSGEPNYNWGSTTIHTDVDNGEQVDGTAMYEKINNDWYVVLANRNFSLDPIKKYYVSFAFDDENITDKNNLSWGKPADVCSLYSDEFSLVQQTVVVTDANGSISTAVTIPCDDSAVPQYDIKAQLRTVDQNSGGSINLQTIKFNWFVDRFPDGKPDLENSTEFKGFNLSEGEHTIYVEPANTDTTVTEGGVKYEICLEPMSFKLRAVKNGPKLDFGFSDVVYPSNYERTVRVGLPQIKALEKQGDGKGYLKIPVRDRTFIVEGSQNLHFVKAANQQTPETTKVMYLSATNDPVYANRSDMTSLKLGELEDVSLARDAQTLNIKFMPQNESQVSTDATVQLHEGYWYEGALIFNEDGKDDTKVLCSGEAFIRFEIVPEYVTWYPTAKGQMSAAWNNDLNWVRSTRQELYKKDMDYVDYIGGIAADLQNGVNEIDIPRQNAYVPMKFTKVTIAKLTGLYYPDLGYIAYRQSNQIATKLNNVKGDEATPNIQYAILAKWDANTEKHGLVDGNLECEKFYGNACDQIYFKPGGELLDQCFLIYNKAWVEKELKPNTWYAMTAPLKDVYAGDMYVPKGNGRQETEAFQGIRFKDTVNSRVNYPFYQRSWDKSDVEEISSSASSHEAYDYAGTGIAFDAQNLKTLTANWSHIYNNVSKRYDTFEGFALKAGDDYATVIQSENALVRLPKEDTQYDYYESNIAGSQAKSSVLDRANNYRLMVDPSFTEGALSSMTMSLPELSNGNSYYLVGNPYMATLSMYFFLRANTALDPNVYVYEDGALRLHSIDTSIPYASINDVMISPMQSFFVKLKDGASASELKFTSPMTIDREIEGGTGKRATEENRVSFTMTAAKGSYSSSAKVVVSEEASSDYDSREDMQLLYDSNLKEMPTIYTVASDQAVALNAVPEVNWIPMGVICDKLGNVEVSMEGIGSLDEPVYLYDAACKSYQELKNGMRVAIKANEHGRYFLTSNKGTTGIEHEDAMSDDVKCYSPTNGLLVVSSSAQNLLRQVLVYTTDGKFVQDIKCEGEMAVNIHLPSALYIIKVTASSFAQPITKKIAVN